MPLGVKITCDLCAATQSIIWHKGNNGGIICNECFVKSKQVASNIVPTNDDNNVEPVEVAVVQSENVVEKGNNSSAVVRKSNRMKPSKYKFSHLSKTLTAKGRSRRLMFKRNPLKSATEVATVHASEHIFFNGIYWQVGDIISVIDEEDGKAYYAQIRGFLQDQFNNKSAVLTWLLPTVASPESSFDPATYVIGPEEDVARKMECMEFVCHAPSEYYKLKTAPYVVDEQADVGYILTPLGYQPILKPDKDELYSLDSDDERHIKGSDSKSVTAETKESIIKAKVKSARLNTSSFVTKNVGRPKIDKK